MSASPWKAGDLTLSIPSYANVNEVTYFHIQVSWKDKSQTSFYVSKRFTHFVELQTDLIRDFPQMVVPDLPTKRFKLFTNHLYHGFIEQRRVLLEKFLQKISEVDEFIGSPHTKLFFDTDRTEIVPMASSSGEHKDNDLNYGYEGTSNSPSMKIGDYVSEEVSEVWIPSIKEMSDHTLFQIHCANADKEHRTELSEWVSLKRYADFVELDAKLREVFPSLAPHFPPLPEKALRVMTDHSDPKFVEERKLLLENYLKKMIRIEQVVNDKILLRFLNADFS